MTQTDTGKAILKLAYDRNGRDLAERPQVGAQRGSRAAFLFNPSLVWGSGLAKLLGGAAGGLAAEDIADALQLCALKLQQGDKAWVLQALVGQEVLLGRLVNEAAAAYRESERLDFKGKRLAHFLALQRAHMRVLSAIANVTASVSGH